MSQLRTRGGRSRLAASLAAACALLLAAGAAQAAPSHMTVQGFLSNTAGEAVTGDYTLLLSLYDLKTAPTAFWSESHTVTVVGGIFDAIIGADVANPLTVADFSENDEVWLGITVIDGPGVADGGETELPRKQLASTGYAFSAGYADAADAANHATTADSATTATSATTAASADALTCTGCVSVAMLGFDPATQAELQAALAALQIPSSVAGFTGGTITGDVTVVGAMKADSFALADGTAVCTAAGTCGPTLASLTCTAPNDIPVYDHATQLWKCGAGSSAGGVNASDLSCSGCVDITELNFDPATQAELTAALAGYVQTGDLAGLVTDQALATALGGYVQTADLSALLTNYVSQTDLSGALQSYVSTAELTAALADYVQAADLADYLQASDLAGYAMLTDLPTSVDGMAGGSITSGVDVTGEVAADVVRQNGNVVCDESGNCGNTLGTFDPTTACGTDQVLRWNGSAWTCADMAAGSVPDQPCTGAGKALQWDGSAWNCISVRDLGLSGGEANGYEVVDDWGDAWDGIARSAKTWAVANQACLDDGARLPTITELWRNRANYGTGNIATSNPTDNQYHWSISPGYNDGYHSIAYLSNNSYTESADSSPRVFRCIWKSQKPAGFSGNRCFGPPGSECTSLDSFYNIDRWSRAPQYLEAARTECALENAVVATSNDIEKQIVEGTEINTYADGTWPHWHWTTSGSYYNNGYDYIRIVKWTHEQMPWWGPTSGWASHAGPANAYPFRCVGKKSPDAGFQHEAPACSGGNCFEVPAGARNRLIADAADRPAAMWLDAWNDCRASGGYLPTTEEVYQLIGAGWEPAPSARWMWTSSAATWGWQTYDWRAVDGYRWNAHYEYHPTGDYRTGEYATPTTSRPYRCVWRETEAEDFLSCAAAEVQMRDEATGEYSCVAKADGDPGGNQNPSNFPPFVDAWGNAWDFFQRAAANFQDAKATCEGLGGRLPVATELYRVRYAQGIVSTELGQSGTATQDYIWSLNPDYRESYRIQVRLDSGAARSAVDNSGTTAPFRCIWPATKPEAFSGHACYGDPTDPCFEDDRLRVDPHPRVSVPWASAQWECRFFGGRMPTLAEFAQLQHAGLPDSVHGNYEWSSEWAYWNGTTYGFAPGRGTQADQADWEFNSGFSEHNWYTYATYRPFRCVFTDVMK